MSTSILQKGQLVKIKSGYNAGIKGRLSHLSTSDPRLWVVKTGSNGIAYAGNSNLMVIEESSDL